MAKRDFDSKRVPPTGFVWVERRAILSFQRYEQIWFSVTVV